MVQKDLRLQKIKEDRLSGIVEQFVSVASCSESEVVVLACGPLAVEVDCPAVHLQEVQRDVGGRVHLEGLEVSAPVDVVLEAELLDLLLPAQTIDRLFGNRSREVLDLGDELDQVGDRSLRSPRQHVSHEDHYLMRGGSVEAVLDHVGPFEVVLCEEALENMLDDFVIGWSEGLLSGFRWLGGEVSRRQRQLEEIESCSQHEQDVSSGQDIALHRDYQSNHPPLYNLSFYHTNPITVSPSCIPLVVCNILIIIES